jgi:hypothetical protein
MKRGKKTSIRPREERSISDNGPPLSVEDRGVMKNIQSRTMGHPSRLRTWGMMRKVRDRLMNMLYELAEVKIIYRS